MTTSQKFRGLFLCAVMAFVLTAAAPLSLAAQPDAAAPPAAAGQTAAPEQKPAAATPAPEAAAPAVKADDPALAKMDRLERAIASTPKGTGKGQINPDAPKGFLGIPGAPEVNPVMAFFWAVWVGWIFSTVGAFGGIMAGIGHMSVFGLGNYASSFGKGADLNKMVTDSIRVSNQWLVGCSAAVTSFKYASLGRIVLPLGLALGIGSIAGSILVPWLTAGKLSFKEYQGYFGLFVLVLGCYLFYETTPMGQARKQKSAQAAKAFEAAAKKGESGKQQTGVKIISISPSRVVFTFCGVEFSFNTFLPVIGGFIIASVAAFLGVGGGFLLVPFLTSISELPMYLAAGTSALAVLIGMGTSITTFMFGGTPVYWTLVGLELGGIVVGSWIGPITAKYLSDKWLKRIFIVLAFYVGIDYALRGFYGKRLLSVILGLF